MKISDELRAVAGWDIFTDAEECQEQVSECRDTMDAAATTMDNMLEALKSVETWWLERGMHEPGTFGCPACIFQVRATIANSKGSADQKTIIAFDFAQSTGVAIAQDGKPLASHWDDHPDYPVEDWQYEVSAGDTRQSYREWCESKAEQAADDAE